MYMLHLPLMMMMPISIHNPTSWACSPSWLRLSKSWPAQPCCIWPPRAPTDRTDSGFIFGPSRRRGAALASLADEDGGVALAARPDRLRSTAPPPAEPSTQGNVKSGMPRGRRARGGRAAVLVSSVS